MVPYGALAGIIRSQQAVFFVGAAASSVGASQDFCLPTGRLFSRTLARDTSYPGQDLDDLPKVAQFADEVSVGRRYLLSLIAQTFCTNLPPGYATTFTKFLGALPQGTIPRLIITTNYDTLIERTLEQRDVTYLAFGHLLSRESRHKGRQFCYSSTSNPDGIDIITRSELNDRIEGLFDEHAEVVLLYKMHGTAAHLFTQNGDSIFDPIVLTENDYINFIETNLIREIPTEVMTMMRKRTILFFGYSLEDWNFRVLLSRVRNFQQLNTRNWACLIDIDTAEETFWDKRGVNIANIDLGEFTGRLLSELGHEHAD